MAAETGKGMQVVVGAIIGLLVVAGIAVGVVAYNANHRRQLQLHDDEVGRQRDAVVNAAKAKAPATLAEASSRPAGS